MSELKNKVVWITGASSGIGQALAFAMVKEGAKLVLSSRREQELNEVAKKCSCEVLILPLDLSDQSKFNNLAKQVVEHFGSIDVLINNGGISQRSEAAQTSLEVDRKLMEVNYFGAAALTKAVLPIMQQQKSGHLVAISSLSGKFGFFLRSAYSASKFALVGFYESLRLEEEKNNIKVSIVFPGFVHTNISQNALSGDGQKHAKLDNNQKGGISSEKCARDIIRGIKKDKHEIISGGSEKWGILVNRLFPNLFYRILRKKSGE
ncbi:SDR family oxidoreductase [Flavobacteriales bacterium]|nr:SDR family oxidoreductase [Flavobacteriales bacterium]